MSNRVTVQFTVDRKQKEEMMHYAKVKGLESVSIFARMAAIAYMRRHPLSKNERNISNGDE